MEFVLKFMILYSVNNPCGDIPVSNYIGSFKDAWLQKVQKLYGNRHEF